MAPLGYSPICRICLTFLNPGRRTLFLVPSFGNFVTSSMRASGQESCEWFPHLLGHIERLLDQRSSKDDDDEEDELFENSSRIQIMKAFRPLFIIYY
ncbi:hypothetical protein AVEN_243107-1 [Araneus ventricosus]|uniref:Uncharacterized protein n=1 Tax=Araneus ventricosus TaxID=182803 RepID=A0A4Y2I2U3_ARAVE|nr:hypothetical protein AVEN_243107-1 [Araneus ventricosus]